MLPTFNDRQGGIGTNNTTNISNDTKQKEFSIEINSYTTNGPGITSYK